VYAAVTLPQNWKTRWFVLRKSELMYYRERNDEEPVRVLDLADCCDCCMETTPEKDNFFKCASNFFLNDSKKPRTPLVK
jgi:hypothetical protein